MNDSQLIVSYHSLYKPSLLKIETGRINKISLPIDPPIGLIQHIGASGSSIDIYGSQCAIKRGSHPTGTIPCAICHIHDSHEQLYQLLHLAKVKLAVLECRYCQKLDVAVIDQEKRVSCLECLRLSINCNAGRLVSADFIKASASRVFYRDADGFRIVCIQIDDIENGIYNRWSYIPFPEVLERKYLTDFCISNNDRLCVLGSDGTYLVPTPSAAIIDTMNKNVN